MRLLPALGVSVLWTVAWWAAYPRLGPWIHAQGMRLLGSTADYFFTYMGPELLLFGFGLVGVPVLYVLLLRRLSPRGQLAATGFAVLAATTAFYADVMLIARSAERLCTREAGLRVHLRVPPAGVLGIRDVRGLTRFGIGFAEYEDARGRLWRVQAGEDDVQPQQVSAPASRYEYRETLDVVVARGLSRDHVQLVERDTGRVLAEAKSFRIFRGWADRAIDFGLHSRPPICWHGVPDTRGGPKYLFPPDLLRAVFEAAR